MINRIYSCLVLMVAAVVISCSDDDGDKIKHFSAQVDAGNSSMYEDKYNAIIVFSTDGGTTWVDYPSLKPGDAYKAKLIYRPGSGYAAQDIGSDGCYVFDWSGSQPGATGPTNSDVADFVMQSNSDLAVVVSDFKPYDAPSWAGDWYGIEDANPKALDPNALTQDSGNPNKFTMDNWWGVGDHAYILLSPAQTYGDQKITVPAQTTDYGVITGGEGVYDQCRKTMDFDSEYILDYDADGKLDTVDFNYHFQREKP